MQVQYIMTWKTIHVIVVRCYIIANLANVADKELLSLFPAIAGNVLQLNEVADYTLKLNTKNNG
jgi:hypothetical protein